MVAEPSGIGAGLLRFADLGCAQVLEGAGSPADGGYRQSVLSIGINEGEFDGAARRLE
jgi:hypothetical protein